jgi:pilus assembly protein CpaE
LVSALEATENVVVTKNLDSYRTAADLARTLRAHATEILFLSFESIEQAIEIVQALEAEAMPVQILGFHKTMDSRILHESMRAGVREFLSEPFERASVMDSLAHVKAALARQPAEYPATNQIFTFLPSKAGVGTSTIALNVSAALARLPDTRVLLADFDLNSGMQRFMLKLTNEFSVADALEHASEMDENLWPSLVTGVEGMDVLHAGRVNPNLQIEPAQIRSLVAFARRHYQALCFDLSGNLQKYSVELMQESKRILLVCTPEIPSLHLAREKLAFLKQLDLDHRVSVVLTRAHKKGLFTQAQVEDLVGVPVIRVIPNDYQGINRSLDSGVPLSKTSALGKAFTAFAEVLMAAKPAPAPEPSGRKFLEFVGASAIFPVPGRD